jgi:hypothetical protein
MRGLVWFDVIIAVSFSLVNMYVPAELSEVAALVPCVQ